MLFFPLAMPAQAQSAPRSAPEASFKSSFAADQLSHRQVLAFQQKAEQLVVDFFAYYALLQQEDLDKDLKKEVIQVMIGLFQSPTDTIVLDRAYLVNELEELDFTDLPKYSLDKVHYTEVSIYQQWPSLDLPLSIYMKNQSKAYPASAVLSRTRKAFGDQTQSVWDVQLKRLEVSEVSEVRSEE